MPTSRIEKQQSLDMEQYHPVWIWITRICFALVFLINIQCAFSFIFYPESYVVSYDLAGYAGSIAIMGIGVAFLMWNATYPLFIYRPQRYRALGVIILIQQLIGLIGESWIYMNLPTESLFLPSSILRFIAFDGVGLIIMLIAFLGLIFSKNKTT